MEQPTLVSTVTSQSGAGQTPPNDRFHDIQQEYSDQWHLLANLESDLAPDAHSEGQQESPASSQNSAASANTQQDTDPNDDQHEKEGDEEWFILGGEESSDLVPPLVPFEDVEMNTLGISAADVNMTQKGKNVGTQLSPYSEQWYELEQLKASVRSLSHAAGLPQSPQPSPLQADETLASTLSSGSLSVENLDEVGLQDINSKLLPQGAAATTQDGVVMMGVAQEATGVAEQVQEDDPDDSGTSFSMDESVAEDKQLRNGWFPLRPSAVGEDDEDNSQVTYAASTVAHGSNSDKLQNIPHAWSDDDSKQSPPERSQPDGRDGPDLRRTPWIASTQPVVPPSAQSSDLGSGAATRKDSGSDVSVLSQPQSDHNITPLDIITRSVPPAKKGASLMSELRQRHAPQLNSDSDTESPVSKLLGPNFRAVQQVLDRLKQDRLTDSVSDEAEEVASEGRSLTEESVQSVSSAGIPAHTFLSRDYGAELTSGQPNTLIDAVLLPYHNAEHTGDRHPLDERHRRYSESNIAREASDTSRHVSSWVNSRIPYDPSEISPDDVAPKPTQPAERKSSQDVTWLSSAASNVISFRVPKSAQPAAKKSSQDSTRFSNTSEHVVHHDLIDNEPVDVLLRPLKMPKSTQPATTKSSQDIRFSSTASSATTVEMPKSTQPDAKKSSQNFMRFSSATSSATTVEMPKSTQLAGKKSSQELMRFSSTASSAANVEIPKSTQPATKKYSQDNLRFSNNSEHILHRSLIEFEPVELLPEPLLPTTNRYLSEQRPSSSVESSLKSSQIAWGEHATPVPTSAELIHITSNEAHPSSSHTSLEPLHDPTPRSSTGSSIPTFRTRELSSRGALEEMSAAIPGRASSVLVDAAASNDSNRTGRDEEGLQNADSDESVSSEDTDDLLTYEPVLEGDRQYLRMQKQSKHSGARQKQPGAIENIGNRIPAESSRDIDNAARMSGEEQSSSTLQSQKGIHGTPLELDDSHIKSLHWSLGAGTISPISVTSLGQVDSQQEKSSTPLGPISERSSVLGTGTLQEQSLEEDETLVQSGDRDVVASKQTESRSTTDFSSSDEIYRPVLYQDVSAHKENRPDESVFQTSSYGIYDIRRSSGPGSTNRRRKALGLEPNPARETASQDGAGMVYISGESTASSVQDGRGHPLGGVEDSSGGTTAYRDAQLELELYGGRLKSIEELMRPKTQEYQLEREADVLRSRQAREVSPQKRDFRDQRHDDLSREDRRSDRSQGYQSRSVSSKDSSVSYSTPAPEQQGPSRDTSDRSRQQAGQYMDSTDPKGTTHSTGHGRRSGSSGKSRSKYTDDILNPSSQQARSEKVAGSRKHMDAKTRHRSRDGSDSHGGKATRLDANISKLSSLIAKSIDESVSSSSQASVIPASRLSSKKSKKHKMTSSSESSDVSGYFNYAFMEPRLRSSIKQKLRLRELLRSVKARDISPIVRTRDSTSTESTSCVSSNETVEREREEKRSETEPSDAATHPPRPQGFEIPFSTSRPLAFDPKCPCTCSQRPVGQMTIPDTYRRRKERYDDGEYGVPRKRDVGVNFPTPVVTRSPSPSSDGSPRLEDASTQTDELESRHKARRKIGTKPVKSQRKSVESPLRNVGERGVISQPSPQKSDFIYRVDQREAQQKPKERFIASQNSPRHGVKTSSDRTSMAPVPVWFHSLTSKTQTEPRSVTQLKTPSKSRSSDELRVDVFEAAANPSPSFQKLSLQEAFLYARPQFAKRSQERVVRIEEAAREKERRKMMVEAAAEENRIAEALKAKPSESPVTFKFKPHVKSAAQLHVPKPRQMTRAEIKELNKRLYKKLPEVKAKNEQMKRQAFYRTNRLRAQLYDKRVRNRLKGAGN